MAPTLSRQQRVALKTWNPKALHALWAEARRKNPSLPETPPMGFSPNVGGFTPFHTPERPPAGTYDPSLDAQEAAAGRGFEDYTQDYGVNKGRAQDDFLLQRGELQTQLDRALADAKTTRGYQHSDYERAVSDLGLNYGRLGDTQAQRANAAGVVGPGGALQQALEKRTANMAHDREPMDTGEQRQQSAYELDTGPQGRFQQDFATRVGALATGLDRQYGDQGDQTIGLARAGRENDQLGTDIAAQRWFQATQAGYDPPQKSALEHGTGAKSFRYVRTPRGTRKLMSTGYLVR